VIALPPLDDGALHVKATCALPRVAARPVGAPGTVAGVAEADAEAGPDPIAFVATTVKL
jgi:hypothetical protein